MPDGAQHQFHRAINASMNTILAKSTYILTRVEILCTLCYKIGLNSVFIVELHEKNDYISCISDLLLRLLQLGNLDKIRLHFAIWASNQVYLLKALNEIQTLTSYIWRTSIYYIGSTILWYYREWFPRKIILFWDWNM